MVSVRRWVLERMLNSARYTWPRVLVQTTYRGRDQSFESFSPFSPQQSKLRTIGVSGSSQRTNTHRHRVWWHGALTPFLPLLAVVHLLNHPALSISSRFGRLILSASVLLTIVSSIERLCFAPKLVDQEICALFSAMQRLLLLPFLLASVFAGNALSPILTMRRAPRLCLLIWAGSIFGP